MTAGTARARLGKASLFLADDGDPWLVAETPTEALDVVSEATSEKAVFCQFTIANPNDEWNGRPVFIRTEAIQAIAPPINPEDLDDP